MSDLKRIVNTLRIHRPEYGAIMSSRNAEKAADTLEAKDAEIKRLKAVVDAAREYEKVFARSRTKPYGISNELQALFDALAALEGGRDASCLDSGCEEGSHKPWCDHANPAALEGGNG